MVQLKCATRQTDRHTRCVSNESATIPIEISCRDENDHLHILRFPVSYRIKTKKYSRGRIRTQVRISLPEIPADKVGIFEQYDPNVGFYYLRARYYDAANGRFNRLDPVMGNTWDPASLHKYLYCAGDPINNADPDGRFIGAVVAITAIGIYSMLAALATLRAWMPIIRIYRMLKPLEFPLRLRIIADSGFDEWDALFMFMQAQRIWLSQARIWLSYDKIEEVSAPAYLSLSEAEFSTITTSWRGSNPSRTLAVFSRRSTDGSTGWTFLGRNAVAVFKGALGTTLAHELGHTLNLLDMYDPAKATYLMYGIKSAIKYRLDPASEMYPAREYGLERGYLR